VITATYQEGLFSDKVALVSGGTSGIGAAIGNALAELGAEVTVTGATPAEAEEATVRASFWVEHATALDVRDGTAVTAFLGIRQPDILINCAGIIRRGEEHDPRCFRGGRRRVNLTGTMRLCTGARQPLAKSKGCIVNTASLLSFSAARSCRAYSASKGGVAQLTKSLAIAYAAEQIR
jgi:NAD(P)-dependent dehydrogenase (short-subunit alcohol dehydrogenase family)